MRTKDLFEKLTTFSFTRFLVSGGVNTLLTYGAYLLLLNAFSYRVAYTISYVAGIVLAFVLSRYFVFKSHRGAKSAVLFPLIYVIQYLLSMVIIWVWVDKIGLPTYLAPLTAILITVPITYLLSKALFTRPDENKEGDIRRR